MRPVTSQDFEMINQWLDLRGATRVPLELYPSTGLIVEGVAAGFMMTTDTSMVIMENFVSNPEASTESREEALHQIISALEEKAKQRGCKFVAAFTREPRVKQYIMLHGGKLMTDFSLYGKEL